MSSKSAKPRTHQDVSLKFHPSLGLTIIEPNGKYTAPGLSALDACSAIAEFMHCTIIYREGIFYFVPNGESPSPEMLATGLEHAKRIAKKAPKGMSKT